MLYWTVIVATTTVGTTLADFADRSLGIGDVGGSLVLFGLVRFVLLSLTRPQGATLGDFLTKPLSTGGLNLGRFSSSAARPGTNPSASPGIQPPGMRGCPAPMSWPAPLQSADQLLEDLDPFCPSRVEGHP